jgi:hypothetical protein
MNLVPLCLYRSSPTTKDCALSRRYGGWNGAKVQFDESMKDEFLVNQANK